MLQKNLKLYMYLCFSPLKPQVAVIRCLGPKRRRLALQVTSSHHLGSLGASVGVQGELVHRHQVLPLISLEDQDSNSNNHLSSSILQLVSSFPQFHIIFCVRSYQNSVDIQCVRYTYHLLSTQTSPSQPSALAQKYCNCIQLNFDQGKDANNSITYNTKLNV